MADKKENDIPDFFLAWDNALNQGLTPGYYEVEELCEIVDIYISEGKTDKAKKQLITHSNFIRIMKN